MGRHQLIAYPNPHILMRARNYAHMTEMSYSTLLCTALREYLDRNEAEAIGRQIKYRNDMDAIGAE